MEPIVYSSHNAGAPQIGSTAGDINTVIKACLITGYRDKAAAGWEMLDEDLISKTLTVRSKNVKSIKSVFVFNDGSAATLPKITGYLDWDETALMPLNEYGYGSGLEMRESGHDWVVIADDKFCWWWVSRRLATTYGVSQAFGDLISIVPSVAATAIIGYKTKKYDVQSTNINDFITSQGIGYLASQPYSTGESSALGGTSANYVSDVYVLSKQVVHQARAGGVKGPAFFVPGLLVAAAEIPSVSPVNGVWRLNVGGGLVNPVYLLRQPWQGYIPISTDAHHWG